LQTIGIVGAGAIGCSLGSKLYHTYGNNFCFVASGVRAEKLRRHGVVVNGERLYPRICSCSGSETVDLLLLCVKNYSLEQTLKEIAPVVSKETVIIPLLNGVTAVDAVRAAYPDNIVPYGIVIRTDAERISNQVTVSVFGEIRIGYARDEVVPPVLEEARAMLDQAGLKPRIYPDMRYMLWRKWMINIGSNQVSVLARAKFKYFGKFPEIILLVREAIQEILEISQKLDIGLTERDRDEIIEVLINYPPEKKTSMLQDIEARRRTEIDYFAGTVIKLGKQVSVPTPVNHVLYYAIKAMEKVGLAEKEEEENRYT